MFGRNRVVGGGSAFDGRLALNQAMFNAQGASLTIDIQC
jgi:hypothetical protein